MKPKQVATFTEIRSCGVQFFSRWYYNDSVDEPWDGPALSTFWDAVGEVVPILWTAGQRD